MYFLSLALLFLTILFGSEIRGSTRWLKIGSLGVQTSAIVKPLLILFFAWFSARFKLDKFKTVVFYFLLLALPVYLIFKQPDLGSSLIILVVGFGIAFISGMDRNFLVGLFVSGLAFVPISWVLLLKNYQKDRIISFLNPFEDPLGSGYHIIQSITAVGSGGLFGTGLGSGTQSQLRFLPERHTDFIFASLAEELGFLGSSLLIVSYFVLFFRILTLIRLSDTRFERLICTGVFIIIFFQMFVNVGMNLGIVPITGVTLPFVSAGGSSLVSLFICLGLVQIISRRTKSKNVIEIS
jgi:rod shape determining protein RodA